MSGADAIVVEQLTKSYRRGTRPALAGVSLGVPQGEILGLIGPNGAGKTTFVGCLLGLLTPTAGRVAIDGRAPDDIEVRRVTGYLPERLQFDRWMTGQQFVSFHHALAGLSPARRRDDVEAVLERVGLEPARRDVAIRKYSRGMLQRVGMAQALLGAPRFLFLDEPASGIDPAGVLAFRDILTELKAQGTTVVLNSHQLDQLERVCDRVAYIEAGAIKQVEDLRAAEVGRRVIVVRWMAGAAAGDEALAALAREAGAELVEAGADRGRFSVERDEQTAALLRGLIRAGHAVIEVGPEVGRLEKYFRPEPSPKVSA
ncbi:MAG TPA: ABC transporter ATP-binding protein [Polyangia bacterium]|nr:ABC transporter ATP-binding protein [Polyangia bacterium]